MKLSEMPNGALFKVVRGSEKLPVGTVIESTEDHICIGGYRYFSKRELATSMDIVKVELDNIFYERKLKELKEDIVRIEKLLKEWKHK